MTTIFIFEVSRTTSKELNRVNKIVGIFQKQKFLWKLNNKEIVKVTIWKMEKIKLKSEMGEFFIYYSSFLQQSQRKYCLKTCFENRLAELLSKKD